MHLALSACLIYNTPVDACQGFTPLHGSARVLFLLLNMENENKIEHGIAKLVWVDNI